YDVAPGQELDVAGTDYKLEIEDLQSEWPLATAGFEGAKSAVARVIVRSPKLKYHRSVLQSYPQFNQDRDDPGKKLSEKGLVDDNIEPRYTDASVPGVMIAAGPNLAPVAVVTQIGGKRSVEVLKEGAPIDLGNGLALTLRDFIERPNFEERPT